MSPRYSTICLLFICCKRALPKCTGLQRVSCSNNVPNVSRSFVVYTPPTLSHRCCATPRAL